MKFFVFIFSLIFSLQSCSDPNDNPADDIPSNLVANYQIIGVDNLHPNGDGSGKVQFTISATNANSYKVLIGDQTIETTTGNFIHEFTNPGLHEYTVYISAYKGTKYISTTINLTVLKSTNLVWSDEFNTNGAPSSSKWGYNTGTGSGGWGNNELQYYTDRAENVIVENGVLKIKLIKENYQGSTYTSARLLSKGKFDFKYGKIEFRAKLPIGGGTWPALWMLGSNIDQVGWPACGEIDVMEHVGNQQNKIFATLHYPEHFGGNGVGNTTTMFNDVSTAFHVYTAEWDSETIKFYIDNTLYFTFQNSGATPFNQKFFIIMNCAMGGNFGGSVDPNFTSSTFEIDYVRVYQ